MTIRIYDNDSGAELGAISESQLELLVAQLEEESLEDRDYYLEPRTLELLENAGADATLMTLLRNAMGEREGLEIRWARTS